MNKNGTGYYSMESEIEKTIEYNNSWIVYFDILGFRERVIKSSYNQINLFILFEDYELILKEIREKTSIYKNVNVGHAWFSDTFLIFSKDNSIQSYVILLQCATLLMEKLLYKQIPMRGAISFGQMIIDEEKKIYMGPALIDAYKYAEDQNWINFVITPSAKAEIIKNGLNPSHHNFTENESCFKNLSPLDTYSYTYCRGSANFDSPHIRNLESMKKTVPNEVKIKYDNTINLIKKCWRKI